MAFRPWICLKRAVLTWPDGPGWAQCALISVAALVAIGAVAAGSGLLHWRPDFADWPLHLAKVMIIPAFGEELIFRGLLIPSRGESRRPLVWIAAGICLFVFWHVVEALTFLPGAHLFLTAPFLACAGILGAACAIMRYRTGALWPAVLLHAVVVFIWQTAFAGPDVAALLKA